MGIMITSLRTTVNLWVSNRNEYYHIKAMIITYFDTRSAFFNSHIIIIRTAAAAPFTDFPFVGG